MFTFTLFKKTYSADNLSELCALFSGARDKSGRGSSTMPLPEISKDGAYFGRFSYNGKVWSNREWAPGTTPIFDPYAAA